MQLYEVLEKSARSALLLQRDDGSMPPGHNGPYHDTETPVRNTAHWLITFLKVYAITGDKVFSSASEKAMEFLTSPAARPMDATFWIRKNPEKDFCNGLIGQAWVIEALVTAAEACSRADFIKLAADTFMMHPYNQSVGGWYSVNVDGSYGHLDNTFNHQLWFAAAGALLSKHDERVRGSVVDFIHRLDEHLALYNNGLIRHHHIGFLAPSFPQKIRNILGTLAHRKDPKYKRMKAIGYHGFNLYGFALLHSVFPDLDFWVSKKFKKSLRYAKSEDFLNNISDSEYGFPYNPPGFEIPYALDEFNYGSNEENVWWVEEQFDRTYDKKKHLLCLNTEDPRTLSARLYEATRLNDFHINIKDSRNECKKVITRNED